MVREDSRWSQVSTGIVLLVLLLIAPFGGPAGRVGAAPLSPAATSGPWSIGGGPPGPVWAMLGLPGGGALPAELIAAGDSRVAVSGDDGATWRSAYDGNSLSGQTNVLLAVGGGPSPTILAGTTAGLYRSTDRGVHWRRIVQGLPAATGVQALVQSGTTLFAGTGNQDSSGNFGGGGVFVSHDSGLTWGVQTMPRNAGGFISALAVTNGNLFVATVTGSAITLTGHLYSRPVGAPFGLSDAGLPTTYRIHALAAGAGWMVAGTGGGFYRSTDGGRHWIHSVQGKGTAFVFALTPDPQRPQVIYGGTLGTGQDTPGAGIWQSIDGGKSWHPSSKGLPNYMDVHAILPARAADGSLTFFAATDGVWRSTDGQTWNPASTGLNLGQVRALAADPTHPGVIFAGATYSGFYRSADGGVTWQVANRGLVNNQPEVLAYGGSGTLYAGTESFVMRWNADHWESLSAHLDKNRNLITLAVGPVLGGADVLYTAEVVQTSATQAVYRLLRSSDLGHSWKIVTPPVLAAAGSSSGSAIRYLAVAPTAPVIVYAATETALYVSGDSGATWTPTGPTAKGATAITALAVDPANSQTAFVATVSVNGNASSTADAFTGAALYRTNDGGLHWSAVRTYGPATLILSIRAGAQLLLTGARLSGQHVTSLLDQSTATGWRSLAMGLPQDVFSYVTASDGHHLYIGTAAQGVWSRPLSEGTAGKTGGKGGGPAPTSVLPGA